ncbi:cytochrome c oxidase assembly protein [mine drainage metagenome]|uniref:Cytochrome c oxidase assembly protein n=2 Tax=mine drainage metagenome TaxID=410659 RepID=T0YGC8_9ZZZZ
MGRFWDPFRLLTLIAIVWTLVLIGVGAYVRLSNAGLSCPGWPACYGHLTVPTRTGVIQRVDRLHPDHPLVPRKAMKEMFHRYLAGGLGLVILAIAVLGWSRARRTLGRPRYFPLLILLLVLLQAALGMWTVTMELEPIIVLAHLIGAFLIFDGLLLLWAMDTHALHWKEEVPSFWGRWIGVLALILLGLQILLGAWTSTHYAWVGCPDFPTCLGSWWPAHLEFGRAFTLWDRLGVDYQGGTLPLHARAAIYLLHRLGAGIVLVTILAWCLALFMSCRHLGVRIWSLLVILLTLLQVAIGVMLASAGMPRWLADSHTVGAALLLGATSLLVYALWTPASARS